MSKNERYERQITLPEIGKEGQERLARASVLCIGAGGLGCPALLYLTAAGIGRIGIVDFDNVEETNLQRQILFTTQDIGQNKAKAAQRRLTALNPDITITAYPEKLTAQNAIELFKEYDIIIDGTDNFTTKFLINDAAIKTSTPFIYGSILGFEGQVAVFGMPNSPCYRCLFPQPPTDHIPNCAEAGIIGAVAGIIGTTQAMEAIKVITAHKSFIPLSGKLWIIDMHDMQNKLLSLSKDPNCPTCSKEKKEITLTDSTPLCGLILEVSAQDAKGNKAALKIDVREADEWDCGHIEDAQHIALSTLMQGECPDLPTDCEIIIYCQKGKRGEHAAQILKAQGCANICNMTGGYEAWLRCK